MATYQYGNPDHRRAVTVPAPSNDQIEARLRDLLTPGTFANLKTVTNNTKQLRDRVLTLPVMAAIVLSLVYRQVSGLSEVLRLLEQEGLMWAGVIQVSKQALSNRLSTIPILAFIPSDWCRCGGQTLGTLTLPMSSTPLCFLHNRCATFIVVVGASRMRFC
jgi:hypothetical protein